MKFVPLKFITQAKWLRRGMNLWPPFIGAGICVTQIDDDFRYAQVRMKLKWYNRNYMSTHYGGSLYSMTDAFYTIMILRNLSSKYYVWDKSAHIDYVAPAKSTVFANFKIDDLIINKIKLETEDGQKYLHEIRVDVVDEQEQLIAQVKKVIYIRKKSKFR